jgi:hypothetical protein
MAGSTKERSVIASVKARAKRSGATSRRRSRLVLAPILAALGLILVFASSALAAETHPFETSFGPDGTSATSFANPESLAVDQTTGDLYVLDQGSGHIARFKPNHEPDPFTALGPPAYISGNELTGTPAGSFSFAGGFENQIAVAPPGAPAGTAGDLYVTEPNLPAIDVFASSGKYLGAITEASIAEACGVATDAAGDLYVGTYSETVEKYVPTVGWPGNATLDSKLTGFPGICNIAATSTSLFAWPFSGGPLASYPLSLFPGGGNSAAASGTAVEPAGSPLNTLAASADPTNDDLYVDQGNRIVQLNSVGALLSRSGLGHLSNSHGLAVRGSTETLYASDSSSSKVAVFRPLATAAPPTATTAGSSASYTSAHLEGEVDPEGLPTAWHFEYTTEPAVPASWQSGPGGQVEGSSTEGVQADLAGLQPETEYSFRLAVESDAGQNTSGPATFETEPVTAPTAEIDEITTFTTTTAHFSGHVNPNASEPEGSTSPAEEAAFESSWHFECVAPGPSCGTPSGAAVPAGNAAVEVSADATDLEPHTAYYLKLVTSNFGGTEEAATTASPSFTTPAIGPDVFTAYQGHSTDTTTVLRAQVNPHNSSLTKCEFQWGLSDTYGQSVPCAPADEVQVLTIDATSGQFRLTFASETTPDLSFDATAVQIQAALRALPAIGSPDVAVSRDVFSESDSLHLHRYRLAFTGSLAAADVPQLGVGNGTEPLSGGAGATVTTHVPGGLPSANQAGEVHAPLSGLTPGTEYHYRFLAQSQAGPASTPDSLFTTFGEPQPESCPNQAGREAQHSTFLPDCRAYERVTDVPNAQRNGADVVVDTSRSRAAADGSAFEFTSLIGFSDAVGVPVAADYMAVRDPAGTWRVHAITPPQQPNSFSDILGNGLEPRYMGDFSPDLDKGVFFAKSPLTEAPNVDAANNLYLRDDLLAPGPGHYRLLTDAVTPQASNRQLQPFIAGASADFSHILFESPRDLTTDSAGLEETQESPKLYEWIDGVVRLVGILPDDECGAAVPPCPAPASQAGQGAAQPRVHYTPHTISNDGSRVIFTGPPFESAAPESGRLYLRDDHGTAATADDTTVRIDAPETGFPLSGPSTYWDATPDASEIFFTNHEELYRYDLNAAPDHHLIHISVDNEPSDGTSAKVIGVLGASVEGNYVYFVSEQNQLVAGGETTARWQANGQIAARIFVWHDGAVREVGGVTSHDVNSLASLNTWSITPQSARVSNDGTHLAFVTRGSDELTGYDHGSSCLGDACTEVYVYDATANSGAGQLECASCNPSGAPAASNANFISVFAQGGALQTSYKNHPLSANGRYVFFTTADSLLPADTNGVDDAYEFDTVTGQLHLLSTGTDSAPSFFLDASDEGKDAFIATRARLAPSDTDQLSDVYDVRIDGTPEPPSTHHEICTGENCRSGSATPPPSPTPQSAGAFPPNPKPSAPCKKGRRRGATTRPKSGSSATGAKRSQLFVRKHGKCVKKHHKSRSRQNRTANDNRGGAK